MKKIFILIAALSLLVQCRKPEFQSKDIIVAGTEHPVINLNGTWKFSMAPPEKFFLNETPFSGWSDIKVPGECAMQGFAIKHNTPYVYKRTIQIPSDYNDKNISIRFEGVYSYARVWVNGVFVRDHSGGFTPWNCNITDLVTPGKDAILTVEFTDFDNDLSFASGYAKHPIGGILRNVTLMALPRNYPKQVKVLPDFDPKYRNANLKITVTPGDADKSWIGFRLYDTKGAPVNMHYKRYVVKKDTLSVSLHIKNPLPWDAEHPNLYTLIIEVFDNRILTASSKIAIGFREIEVKGNKLLVNGMPVKLRGACRHDIDPLLGRTSTRENDSLDVLLAKEANMNFIRTSHYPPSESFLRFCDRYGIYVEDESAVCFVDTHRGGIYRPLKQSGQEFISQQVSQVKEMVNNHFNHPSVIIWSLGNESKYNEGFQKEYDYIKSVDVSRPVMFSYPGSVPDSTKCYDIISLHYPSYTGNIDQYGISVKKFSYDKYPVIYDEWAHVPCYNKPELLADMNVRNFWGVSLDSMWSNLYDSDGTGGAIWGMIDETFMLPDTMSGYNKWWGVQEESNGVKMFEGPTVGYGEWGIIDTWRRRKPEFWNTKKAYSPIKILLSEITDFQAGWPIIIPVRNRFSHTNLKEIIVKWKYRDKIARARLHHVDPGDEGVFQLTPSDWREGEIINIKFLQKDSSLIDEYNLPLGIIKATMPLPEPGIITTEELKDGKVKISGLGFKVFLNKKSGLLENLVAGKDTLIKSGPWLQWKYPVKEAWSVIPFEEAKMDWKLKKTSYEIKDSVLVINTEGLNGKTAIEYSIRISEKGIIEVAYIIKGIPDITKADELGLKFITGRCFGSVSWKRKGYWSAYPSLHPGTVQGNAEFNLVNENRYRLKPGDEWSLDNKSFFYNGLAMSDQLSYYAGSMKENILNYSLKTADNYGVTVCSDGNHSARITRNGSGYMLYIDRYWDYLSLNWGNYVKNVTLPNEVRDTVYMKLSVKR